jgi:RimJ/RimL family protein N-acetyltransferase
MNEIKTFETERLILKPTAKEDALLLLEIYNSPKWLKYIGNRNVNSLTEAEEYIKNKITPHIERLGFGNYTIIRKSDGEKVGFCGLFDREGLEGIDIGFALLPKFEGKGYAYESAINLKKAAFSHFNLTELSAITDKENQASQNLLLKIGFKFEKSIQFLNANEEILLYKLKSN